MSTYTVEIETKIGQIFRYEYEEKPVEGANIIFNNTLNMVIIKTLTQKNIFMREVITRLTIKEHLSVKED